VTDDDGGFGDRAGAGQPVTVERATMDDLDAVVEGWLSLAADQRGHGSHVLVEPNRETVTETVGGHVLAGEVLVARPAEADRADGETAAVSGFVVAALETDGYERDVTRGDVPALWVAPDRRGGGVGAALLAAAEDLLADRGAERVRLEVLAANDGAARFYEREGYREHRRVLEKPLDGSDDGAASGTDGDSGGTTDAEGDGEKR